MTLFTAVPHTGQGDAVRRLCGGMDELRDRFNHGRRDMLEAFLDLSTLARRAGVDEEDVRQTHGQFFDGNVEIKKSFRVVVLLAEIRMPPSRQLALLAQLRQRRRVQIAEVRGSNPREGTQASPWRAGRTVRRPVANRWPGLTPLSRFDSCALRTT